MIKKLAILGIVFIMLFSLTACENKREEDTLTWTNDNSVYASVKAGYETEILNDVEGAFSSLNFQKVYVKEKNMNSTAPLVLLFVLEDGEKEKQQEFIELLYQDSRIFGAQPCRDLPFETVDTRYIEKLKDTIAVGESLTLRAKGSIEYYTQRFSFEGFLIKPKTNRKYRVSDFPQVNLKSVRARDNGWFYLELAKEGYFNVIKAMDILSRMSTIEQTNSDKSGVYLWPPSAWGISDRSIANFVGEAEWDDYPKAVIIGITAGKVTVYFDDVSCEITVI